MPINGLDELVYDPNSGTWIPNPEIPGNPGYIDPSTTGLSGLINSQPPAPDTTGTSTNVPSSTPDTSTTTAQPPANTQVGNVSNPPNTMPLNGQDEFIIDPTTGTWMPNPDYVAASGSGTPANTNPVTNPVTNPTGNLSDLLGGNGNTTTNPPVTNPGDTPVGTAGAGGNNGVAGNAGNGGTYNYNGGSGGASFTSLLPDGQTFTQAPLPTGVSGNYSQVQNAIQSGQFGTVGQSTDQTTQNTSENTTQNQTGTTQQNTQSTSTTSPNDTLGLGNLITGQVAGTQANDAAREAFLKDVMSTGGQQLGSQVDQAVRNSLTGSQMTGAGDSARARAAGYAGAEIGRNNLNQRLAASEQLNAPSGLTGLVSAGTPLLGQTTSNSGSSDSITNLLNSTSTTGLSSLLKQGTESNQGATAAQSSQAGAGNIPEGQPVKTGGCVLCTAAIELGLSNHRRILREVIDYKLTKDWTRFRRAARGYFAVFTPFARWLLGHPKLARTLWPLAKGVVYEELRVSGRKLPFKLGAWLVHWAGHWSCSVVGLLPVAGHVTDPVITGIAKREGILFNVKGGC